MKRTYSIEVDCPNCAAKMETAVAKLDGVVSASVNFITQKMTIESADGDQTALMKSVVKACKRVEPDFAIELK